MTKASREADIRAEDNRDYWRFTGPQRLDKARHSLEGLLRGVAMDGAISDLELAGVYRWMQEHADHAHQHPFNELLPFLEDVLADGVIQPEEAKDVLWLCNNLSTRNIYFDAITSDIQRLQGLLGGIVSDARIQEAELKGLQDWMEARSHLRGCWPFDELDSVMLAVLRDRCIDANEHRMLMALFSEFMAMGTHRAIDLPLNELVAPIGGICAACPEITFCGKAFCFTGRSVRAKRRDLAALVERLGGTFVPSVTKALDYLIIGAEGNAAWAFACYGRKVEEAMILRKGGHPVTLVHENDFWDGVAEEGLEPPIEPA